MKTSLLDKSVAIGVVSAAYVALIALWAPHLDAASRAHANPSQLQPQGPVIFEAEAGCAVEPAPAFPAPPRPGAAARKGFWL